MLAPPEMDSPLAGTVDDLKHSLGEWGEFRPRQQQLRKSLLHISSEWVVLRNGPVCDMLSLSPSLPCRHSPWRVQVKSTVCDRQTKGTSLP